MHTVHHPVGNPKISGFRFHSDDHPGTDYASQTGDLNLYAVRDGDFMREFFDPRGGNIVEYLFDFIDGRKFLGRYGHLKNRAKNLGRVQEGQTIAEMGASGLANGIHCHFQIDLMDGYGWRDPELALENIRLIDVVRPLEDKLSLDYVQLYETLLHRSPTEQDRQNYRNANWPFEENVNAVARELGV